MIARPVMRGARTATIGRFEATLVRDRPNETVAKSGVRALDWREAVRVPIEPGMVEWKLYVRLFDDIDREFAGDADAGLPRVSMPFLQHRRWTTAAARWSCAPIRRRSLRSTKSFPPPSYGGGAEGASLTERSLKFRSEMERPPLTAFPLPASPV